MRDISKKTKILLAVLVTCLMVEIGLPTSIVSAAQGETPVDFEDYRLKKVVVEQLDVSNPTPTDMLHLVELHACGMGIMKLTGLEHAVNLNVLWLHTNRIEDISTLSGLRSLTELHLTYNQIEDISALRELTELTKLWLRSNKVTDISALAGLTELTDLQFEDNQVKNISALAGLTNLTDLYLSSNQITDIAALAELTQLVRLELYSNHIVDIAALEGLTSLNRLILGVNQIENISALAGLTSLTYLHLTDLAPDPDGHKITDISALAGLTSLTGLGLGGHQITDIFALAELTNLTSLDLLYNQIIDITPLDKLTSLTSLDLTSNNIDNISALAELDSLTNLYLPGNQIADISALAELTRLTTLDLRSNQVVRVFPLSSLTGLRTLKLEGNPLICEALCSDIQAILDNIPIMEVSHDPIPEHCDCEPAAQTIYYVDDDANPEGNGSSWALAFNSLQDALRAAKYGDEIRVATGIYRPDQGCTVSLGERQATFQLKNNVTLIGGYAGLGHANSHAPDDRDSEEFTTILSGDLAGNDTGDWNDPSRNDNSFHVVTADWVDNTALIDGFAIIAGNCLDELSVIGGNVVYGGAGVKSYYGSPTIRNSTFAYNSAHHGGGVSIGYASAMLVNCKFIENQARTQGGAIHATNSSDAHLIKNCLFIQNSAGKSGAAVYGNNIRFVNSVFQDNLNSNGMIDCWGYREYRVDKADIIIDNITIDANCITVTEPCAGTFRKANIRLEGDLNLASGTLDIYHAFFDGPGQIALGEDVLLRFIDVAGSDPTILFVDINGPGNIQVEAGQRLIVGENAIIDLHRQPEDRCEGASGGQIIINGELLLQDQATIRNSTLCVNQIRIEGDSRIQYNNINLMEASTGYGGQFYVQDSASVIGNYIRSEGDRYLDLDPDPHANERPTISNNRISVIIKEGALISQGTLLELRAGDYDGAGGSGAYQLVPLDTTAIEPYQVQSDFMGFSEKDPSENWVLEKLELKANSKLNLTNRQGFVYLDLDDPNLRSDLETVYVRELVMGPNSVLNTALQTLYYQDLVLVDSNGLEVGRNPVHEAVPQINGAQFKDIPLLGFSLGIIAMDDQTPSPHNEFDIRVRKDPINTSSSNPDAQYVRRLEGLDTIPSGAGGIMEMRTWISHAEQTDVVTAKGAFSRAGDEDITIEFEYMFPDADPGDAYITVYLSDHYEVGHEGRIPLARVYPPNSGRPGAWDQNRFAIFSIAIPRGQLNFTRGTYVELELHGHNARCWIDNWDPQVYCGTLVCGNYNGKDGVDLSDYLLLWAESGLTNPSSLAKGCLDLVTDGYITPDDALAWETYQNTEINCYCPPAEPNESENEAHEQTNQVLSSAVALTGFSDGLNVVPPGPLLILGKGGVSEYGYLDPDNYLFGADPANRSIVSQPHSGIGRLVTDREDRVYRIDPALGLIKLDKTSEQVIVKPAQWIPYGNRLVSIGHHEPGDGVITDAVFHPANPNIVYIVPVRVFMDNMSYRAAAKLNLDENGDGQLGDYEILRLYGDDPNISSSVTEMCPTGAQHIWHEPDYQHLSEVEVDAEGKYLLVLSTGWTNENNWMLTYEAESNDPRGQNANPASNIFSLKLLYENGDPNLPLTAPGSMLASSDGETLYFTSSAREPDDSDGLDLEVYSFLIDKNPAGSITHVIHQETTLIGCKLPQTDICNYSLCEPNQFVSMITSMAEAPNGTLYAAGYTAPRFRRDVAFPTSDDLAEKRIGWFTSPLLVEISQSGGVEYLDVKTWDPDAPLALPLSIVWTGSNGLETNASSATPIQNPNMTIDHLAALAQNWLIEDSL